MLTPATEETLLWIGDNVALFDYNIGKVKDATEAISLDVVTLRDTVQNHMEASYVALWTISICVGVQFGLSLYDRFARGSRLHGSV